MVTWLQLGFHQKPVALLNIDAFYQHLLGFFDHCVTEVSRSAGTDCPCMAAEDVRHDVAL